MGNEAVLLTQWLVLRQSPLWWTKSVDNLGDQFRPAMRAGWLSYIRRVYPDDGAPDAGLVVGEGTFVVQE